MSPISIDTFNIVNASDAQAEDGRDIRPLLEFAPS
jgi:hypothetical protein